MYALIFIAVLAAVGLAHDVVARRRRGGLAERAGTGTDQVGRVEHIRPGTTTEAGGIRGSGLNG